MTTDTKNKAWTCCGWNLDDLAGNHGQAGVWKFCPECGRSRPKPEPVTGEDKQLAWELFNAGEQARYGHGHRAAPFCVWNQREKAEGLAMASRARALLATEPAPLTDAEIDEVVSWWFNRGSSRSAREAIVESARRQRRKTSPAQPEPAPAKAQPDEPSAAPSNWISHGVCPECKRDVMGPPNCGCNGTLYHHECWEKLKMPPEPSPAPSPETTALDAWLDSHDVMQSTRSEVRHCYRSDLARELAAILAERDAPTVPPPKWDGSVKPSPCCHGLLNCETCQWLGGFSVEYQQLERRTASAPDLDAPTAPPPQGAGTANEPKMTELDGVPRWEPSWGQNFIGIYGVMTGNPTSGAWVKRGEALDAARQDAIDHAESVAGPLRARIAALELQLAEAKGGR
jgi:hypothetical protein